MGDAEVFKTKKQLEIELAVTNGVGFKDNPRTPSIKLEGEITLLHLRVYLSTVEADVSLSTRSPKGYFEALGYFGDLGRLIEAGYQENFNLNTPKGIDNAIKFYKEGLVKMFNTRIGAVA